MSNSKSGRQRGLTSNPTIFDHAIENTDLYDDAIRQKSVDGVGEKLFVELAIEDLRQAATLFRPIHDASLGLHGWVSLEVSPLVANDTAAPIKEAAEPTRYARTARRRRSSSVRRSPRPTKLLPRARLSNRRARNRSCTTHALGAPRWYRVSESE